MYNKNRGQVWGCLFLVLASAMSAWAQCNVSPEAAVRCFATNAVKSGLASLPEGMTLSEYKAYGVAVSNIVQTPSTLVFLAGMMGAVSDALPAVSADGTQDNQAAQDAAVDSILDAALADGLLYLPEKTNADQLKMFAHSLAATMAQNDGINLSAGSLLRFLDSYLLDATGVGGVLNTGKLQTGMSKLVDSLVRTGLLKLPDWIPAEAVKQFAYDVAIIVNDYKAATGRARL